MGKSSQRIALHVLILESATVGAEALAAVIRATYPHNAITTVQSPRQADHLLRTMVFDLVILSLSPIKPLHHSLLHALRQRLSPMPTVLFVEKGDEDRLHRLAPDMPVNWEIADSSALSQPVIERLIRKAVESYQQCWELMHLKKAFQSSVNQYRNLFDEVPDLIFLCDKSGCLLDINATGVRVFGRTKETMLLQSIFDVFGIRPEHFERLIHDAMEPGHPVEDLEIELHSDGGQTIYGLIHLVRCQDTPGRPAQFQGVIKDISSHKLLEQQLRHSEDKYRTLFELSRVASASLGMEDVARKSIEIIHRCCRASGTVLLFNSKHEQLSVLESVDFPEDLKKQMEDDGPLMIGCGLIGQWAISPGIHIIRQQQPAGLPPAIANWMSRQEDCALVGATLGRTNPTLPAAMLLMTMTCKQLDALEEDYLNALMKTLEMGITNCFHYASSHDAEMRYRELWDQAPVFFISILKGGVVYEINQTALSELELQVQDVIGHPFQRLVHPDDHLLFKEQHERLLDGGNPANYELRLIKRNGQGMMVCFQSEPLRNLEGHIVGEKSVLRDITHDKEMEAQLLDYATNLGRKVEDRTNELTQTMNFLNGILEGSTEYAIMALDEAGNFLHFNRGAQILFGYKSSAMVGNKDLGLLLDFAHAPWKDLPALLKAVDQQGVLTQELPMMTADNMNLMALLTINRLKSQAANNLTYVAIMRDITEQKELEDLLKLYTENLQQVIEQKTRELDRQHIQLIQSSKLATLGEMATGIAHELNQPLSGIRTRAQLINKGLERNLINNERIQQGQDEIIQLVDRITRIINHMRIFARQDQQRFAPFNLTQSIDGALSLLGEQMRIHAVEVIREVPDLLPPVLGEPLQIEQVILNLASNARDAMDVRAEEERKKGNDKGYRKQLLLRLAHPNPREVHLEVQDNGMGMSDEIKSKIFEPFYTTKAVGRGTGLGLSISYGILTSHNGRIEVDSEVGIGTTFRVILPVWDGLQEEAQTVAWETTTP